jgi:hypothetical protein
MKRFNIVSAWLVFGGVGSPAFAQGLPPIITNQPMSRIVVVGTDVTISVGVAQSATPLRFQWRKDAVNVGNATNSTLLLTNVQLTAAGVYSVQVSNAGGTTPSSDAALEVVRVFDQSVSLGASVTFAVTARGPAPPTAYQWRFNDTDLQGQTSRTLVLNNVTLARAGVYSAVVFSSIGLAMIRATLTVDPTFTKITAGEVVQPVTTSFDGVTANYPNGCAWADYDNDGFLDLAVWNLNRAAPSLDARLYRNNREGTLAQVARALFPLDFTVQSVASWADFDNDGYLDLLGSRVGRAQLLKNNRDGSFSLTNAGQLTSQTQTGSSSGSLVAAWADYDGDGWLDVFLHTSIYKNNGDGTFTNVTAATIGSGASSAQGGRVWGDYDNDGHPDVFVLNYGSGGRNRLYRNNRDGTFTEQSAAAGVGSGSFSYASGWGDYDNDGFLDLFVANGEPSRGNFLYHNRGDGTFARSAAFDAVSPPNVGTYACAWGDYDNDGYLDLFLANYGRPNDEERTVNLLYRNNGDGTFSRVTTGSLANDVDAFGGCSWADYDNDGFLDLYVTSHAGHNLLYRNNGNANGWLQFKLVGRISNRSAIGAKVRVKSEIRDPKSEIRTLWQLREINGGDGDSNSQPLLVHFGLGDATLADTVRIEWPSGIIQELRGVAAKQFLTVTEAGVGILPFKQELVVGSTMTFRAATTLAGPVNYQWRFNGVALADGPEIAGATSATLTIQNAQTAHAGEYTVLVTKADGTESLTSFPVYLTLPGPPVIAKQPQSQIVAAGADVTLTVGVVPSSSPVRYQWQTGLVPIAGATGASLVLTGVPLSAGGDYSVIVNNSVGSVTSDTARLTVVQDASKSASLGGDAILKLTVRGPPVLSYQWRFNGADIPGATSSTLTLKNVQLTDVGQYSVVVGNAAGTAIVLSPALVVDPTFTKITAGPMVNEGGSSLGCSWGDYDNDEDLDLFVANGFGQNNFLYRNNGDGTFTKITSGGIVGDGGFSGSGVWGDYDNDGDLDLFVTNSSINNSPPADFFYENNGNGTFTRITAGSFVNDTGGGFSSAWGDYDNDGFLDLFVANGALLASQTSFLYHNGGDRTFTRITRGLIVSNPGQSTSCAWGDYDNDGFLDPFVANEAGQNSYLYRNNGNGTFELPNSRPFQEFGNAQSSAWADYDNDGFLDLLVANTPANELSLYRNNGDATFTRLSGETSGLATSSRPANGCAWADYDNDGLVDVFVPSGSGPNFLYRNKGDGTFGRITVGSPTSETGVFYGGCAWGDYDNDGFPDLFVGNGVGNNFLYRNNGNNNAWIKLKLVGTRSNRAAIGAKVRVKTVGRSALAGAAVPQTERVARRDGEALECAGLTALSLGGNAASESMARDVSMASESESAVKPAHSKALRAAAEPPALWQMREISGGSGYGSQNDLRANFGLGDATAVDTLRIEWPSGIVQEMHDVAVKRFLTVVEPPRLAAPVRLADGSVQFQLIGAAGIEFGVESSTDLVTWTPLVSLTNKARIEVITDATAAAAGTRFYRAIGPGPTAFRP